MSERATGAAREIGSVMRKIAPHLFFFCAVFHAGTNGTPLRLIVEQVAAIGTADKIGSAATAVTTLAGVFYVKETPEQVAAALAAATECK